MSVYSFNRDAIISKGYLAMSEGREGIKLGGESRWLVQCLCTTGSARPRPAALPRFIIQVYRLGEVTIIGFIGTSGAYRYKINAPAQIHELLADYVRID